jgi:Glycosyl hydrolase family 30 beta sandwich domain
LGSENLRKILESFEVRPTETVMIFSKREGTTSSSSALDVSAFRDSNGSWVVEILNTGTTAQPVSLRGLPGGHVTGYITNESDVLTAQPRGPLTAPARSLPTVVIN